jgi:2-dehydropantoate 2-reductase
MSIKWVFLMRIAIVGVGSIGGILLGSLADSEADLIAVARGNNAAVLSEMGLVLHTPEGSIEVVPPERYITVDSAAQISEQIRGTCDVAIVCGKTVDTPLLSQITEEILANDGVALTIQNGLGNAEALAHRIGRERVLVGSITHGAMRRGEGEVEWVGRGSIIFGGMSEVIPNQVESLVDYFNEVNLNAMWVEDYQRIVWRKLLLNVAINPICAIAGVRNGALLEINSLWLQSVQAMREAAIVARAAGIDLGDIDIEDYLRKVVIATAENRCSMLQDIMAGRPTEIDSLCGAVVLNGEAQGVPTPFNAMLHGLVKGIEESPEFG